ncbi:MAG: hypothetical protein PUP93_33150 [Rhizonema sp. NSF051]|nr:hypothetical protein [Rhizonema sp. NSF051]
MANNNSTSKAQRTTITLGDIELEVFLMPDGEYRLSQTQALAAIGIANNWFSQLNKKTPKILQALQDKGFRYESIEIKIEGNNSKIKAMSIDDVSKVWGYFARNNNDKAMDLLESCTAESIERRADAKFGKVRTEAERDARLKARLEGKIARRTLTDSIKDYLDTQDGLSDNYRKWIYGNATDGMHEVVFGMSAIEMEDTLGCARHKSRDHLSSKCLRRIEWAEASICQQIDIGFEPMQAINRFNRFNQIQKMKPERKLA